MTEIYSYLLSLNLQIELMKKKLAAARRRIENGDGAKEGEEEEEVTPHYTTFA